jgi:hypothetical protein
MTRSRLALAAAVAVVLLAVVSPARAQIPTVEPDGSLADPAAPPPAPPPTPIIITPPGQPASPQKERSSGAVETETGYYHSEDYGMPTDQEREENGATVVSPGTVPATHMVRSGDTLWDLSWTYFSNPWEWPRVWSYNPEITNPHWIYPGDQVRLRAPGSGPEKKPAATARAEPRKIGPVTEGMFELRQMAFLASEELELGIVVEGSPEEKIMLATGDEVYLTYPSGKPPRVGQHYAVYLERERVVHPTRDEDAGAYVRVIGEVEVISAAVGKRARGVITDSVDVIERGMQLGPVERQFQRVEQVPAEVDLEGTIVAEIGAEELIGARQVVFIDRGSEDRVRVGNHFHAIRRGDGYEGEMDAPSGIGKNDGRYPARSVGEILVVQTGKTTSVAVVVRSDRELGVGDRVLLNRARKRSRR